MKQLLAILCAFSAPFLLTADPGDTLVVQTYTFDEQNNPETDYDSPGRRWFEFPEDDGTEYQKILMSYTLKCFEDGTAGGLGFPCGEWDYLTYNYLYDHTGELDSNLLAHPLYLLSGQDFDEAEVLSEPQFDQVVYAFLTAEAVDANNTETHALGAMETFSDEALRTNARRSRYQFLYTADELSTAGITAGSLGQLTVELGAGVAPGDLVRIKVGTSNNPTLEAWFDGTLTEVYAGPFSPDPNGAFTFPFYQTFDWDGTTGLVFEWSVHQNTVQGTTATSGAFAPQMAYGSAAEDRYVSFDNIDFISLPQEAFESIENEVTVSFWVYGDPEVQPSNSTVFEGVNANNQRVLNSHLPWGNGRVYWDAGQNGGYDRIDAQASADDYEGKWNHWAFTKNAETGEMRVYLNGELWHSGSDRFRTMEGIVKFSIGSAAGWSNHYNGRVDEFSLWNTALDETTISEWMQRTITEDHPGYDALVVYYDFNEEDGEPVIDHSGNGFNGTAQGAPQRRLYEADELFFNGTSIDFRPHITLEQGDYTISTGEGTMTETLIQTPVSLSTWFVDGYQVSISEQEYVWLPGYTYTYDETGVKLDSAAIGIPGELVVNDELSYYGVPFEIIDRYELGRFITPYGIGLDMGEDGWTWTFDVTDYEPLLHDMVELEAGNWQELLDMKFLFIEGTPTREVKRVEAFWKGMQNLNVFDENITDYTFTPEDDETNFRLKTRASGHGFGSGNNCAEFCFNTHTVEVNGSAQWSWEIMQECADNPLYPQGGTWIYDRAGWCPGDKVTTQNFELTPHVEGMDSFTVDYDIDFDPDGNYRFEGQIIAYGDPNFEVDAELVDILAPSSVKVNSRMNPICDEPVVRIRNNGTQPLTSLSITYGIDEELQTLEWTGNLGFLETEDVQLQYDNPSLWQGDSEQQLIFRVELSNANGGTDENAFNNTGTSAFVRPPVYTYGEGEDDDNRLIIWLKTNNQPWENRITIQDADGNVVFFRDDYNEANFNYRDTIQLNAGCYRFHLQDIGDDGLSFFANNDGNGFCRLKRVAGGSFINFEDDFGKEIVHHFSFATDLVGVEEQRIPEYSVQVYPNPGNDRLYVRPSNFDTRIRLEVFSLSGQRVLLREEQVATNGILNVDTSEWPQGIYQVVVSDGQRRMAKRWLK